MAVGANVLSDGLWCQLAAAYAGLQSDGGAHRSISCIDQNIARTRKWDDRKQESIT